jgi:CRISPR-associated protein Cas8a1/Csx13
MALEMKLKLNAPGMTSLHKAGLAGLYMTLKAFDKKREEIEGLQWILEDKQVTLNWTDETPKKAFERLVKESFWIDKEGFIRLYGLEPRREMTTEQKHLLYQALLNSFLQYGKHRKKLGKRNLGYEVDDKKIWIKDFEPLQESVVHKYLAENTFSDKSQNWFEASGEFKKETDVSGWLYPGASKRHNMHSITANTESISLALSLLFAPVGVIYYLIRSKAKGRKSRLALLIPEITNLRVYARAREIIAQKGVIDLTASSSSDAALRMLIALKTTESSDELAEQVNENFLCRIITFGIVGWNEKQKSRTAARTVVSGKLNGFENYHLADTIFKNKWQQSETKKNEPENFWLSTFCAREMIADNIANNKTWYHNISEFLAKKETREQLIKYERKELRQMVKEAEYDNENERLFIDVCHTSWRRRMKQLGQRETHKNTNFSDMVNKEREKMRVSLGRCKNAESLREAITDFWSRAGSIEQLQGGGLMKILPLFEEKNWRKAKDLALLALVSYQAPEEKAKTNSETEGENE